MSEAMQIVIMSAVVNGAVTWGVMNTKLAWLRADIEAVVKRVWALELGRK